MDSLTRKNTIQLVKENILGIACHSTIESLAQHTYEGGDSIGASYLSSTSNCPGDPAPPRIVTEFIVKVSNMPKEVDTQPTSNLHGQD